VPSKYKVPLWQQLAQEARSAAVGVKDPNLKFQVLTIAIRDLVLAKRAARADAARDSDSPDLTR
jgi:hypothetical protein